MASKIDKNLMTQKELADVFKISAAAISQKKEDGTLSDELYVGSGKRKKLKRFEAIAAIINNFDWSKENQKNAIMENAPAQYRFINQTELAEAFNVTKQHISDLSKDGVFPTSCYEDDKLLRLYALKAYVDHKEKKVVKNFPGEKNTITENTSNDIKQNSELYSEENLERLKQLTAQAKNTLQEVQIIKDFWTGKISEQKFLEGEKLLIPKEQIIKDVQRILKAFRDKTLSLPTKMSGDLVGLKDKKDVAVIVESYCYELLEELSSLEDIK